MDMDIVQAEVEEWVTGPSTIARRLFAYERIITTYWVTKELVAHVLMDRENKEMANEEPFKAWK